LITVTLYTKEGCGLCEEVKQDLTHLQAAYPHQLSEVDINSDPALFERYRFAIPVIRVGKIELQAPITAVQLKAALAAESDGGG
jgi:glutaredoxin